MQCDKKKCKKCGMYWNITQTNEQGNPVEKQMCGHIAIYFKLDSLQRSINAVRADNHEGRNRAMTTLKKIVG